MIAAPWSIAWPVDARVRPSPLSPAGPDAPRAVTPCFTLLVVASADGLIGRHPGHSPADWASAEEQALFLSAVDAADWSVMGRGTHETAFRPQRRRIVFSRSAPAPQWRAPAHLWLDPARLTPDALAALVEARRPLRNGLILGGGAVHDWFHACRRIDAVSLTIEPVRFGDGLPLFSDQRARDPVAAFTEKGYKITAERRLNAAGTRLVTLAP